MSLRNRIMLLVAIGILVATLPLGVMGLGMVQAATDRVLEERLAMTASAAEYLSERVTEGWSQLDRLSASLAMQWGDRTSLPALLGEHLAQITLFSGGLIVADLRGNLAVQVPASPQLLLPRRPEIPILQQAVETRQPQVSGLTRTPAGIPVLILAVPVFATPDVAVGAVAGVIDLSKPTLLTFIDGLAIGRSGHAAIVSADGTVLASTDTAELFTRDEHPRFFRKLIAEGRALVAPAEENGEGKATRETHIMAFAPLTTVPWGLGIGQSEEETFGPIRRLRGRIIFFELAVLGAALFFAWLDTSAVVSPLRVLKEAAERIAGGDLARKVEVRRTDEIGTLARSFETMRLQLVQSLEEVRRRAHASQSLYEAGTEVLSLQDRDAVLRSIAARAVSLLQADVALVCLLDATGTTARIGAAAGAAAAAAGTAPFPTAGRLLGTDCLACANVDPIYQSAHIAAPLAVGGRHIGALCVGARQRTFSAEDREVLSGLANLAAITVENARLQEQVESVAMLEERERIAREMHDSVGQVLGYVNTKAQAVQALLESGKVREAHGQLAQLEQAAREVYADLREAILSLRATTGPEHRLLPALAQYVRRFSELSGVETRLTVDTEAADLEFGPTVEVHLIRIIQEALTNVRRHAQANRASVRFAIRNRATIVTVEDDGVGIDADPGRHGAAGFGLQTMRERVEAIGGAMTINARSTGGTVVEIVLPAREGGSSDARLAG